eukprot:7852676-Pyramimonas_sp.AAC.1
MRTDPAPGTGLARIGACAHFVPPERARVIAPALQTCCGGFLRGLLPEAASEKRNECRVDLCLVFIPGQQ